MSIVEKVNAILKKRGLAPRKPTFLKHPDRDNPANDDIYCLQDDSDGRGPHIHHWGKNLGKRPTSDEGLSIDEARFPMTAEEIRHKAKERRLSRQMIVATPETVGWLGRLRDERLALKKK